MPERQDRMKDVKRIVVKVGSSTLTYPNGRLNLKCIDNLVWQLADLHNRGIEVVLVSSGAIAAGMGKLGLSTKPKSIPKKQACAAVGQVALMHMYDKMFGEYGKSTAQILITREDMDHKDRLVNAKNTFNTLIKDGVIPIVNENDAIVTEEIKIGDNDTLSAYVSNLVGAQLLILLSDIDGLYDSNPSTHENAKLIDYVDKVNEDIYKLADGGGSKFGTGGMLTKLKAAEIVNSKGSAMVIVNGSCKDVLESVIQGENIGTFFEPAIKFEE